MTVKTNEMTLSELFGDPLILSVMRADGVSVNELKELMFSAQKALKSRDGTALVAKFRTSGRPTSSKRTLVTTMQPLFPGSFQPCCANM
ncbi:hypothetical protein [Rhizobium skierniewicense]|uniref:hypothetical protein n=1 Tax=Rhizobium skierniewicense TaxID=984260 RepID=UPI00157303C3|nr:hypothetical protein [Rhizobium skierniewicense]NTF34634.1 hypothetical protein [Rhizobium skierniewicense]